MKIHSLYRIIIAPVILSVIIIYLAFYSVGVVEKNIAEEEASAYISSLVTNIFEDSSEYEQLTENLCQEYELKVKTLSVLISQLPKTLSEDMTSEELRIASGADEIMISDANGLIIFSTTPDSEIGYVNEQFRDGLWEKNYCSTVISKSDECIVFETAVSRRNNHGLIIARFVNTALNDVFNYNGSSYAIRRSPAFKAGTTAVINLDDSTFTAHTNADLIGTECIIPTEKFRNQSGYFSYRYTHEPSFVFYEYYDDSTVIMTVISKEYVYTKRTLVLIWLLVLDFAVLLGFILAARSYIKNS